MAKSDFWISIYFLQQDFCYCGSNDKTMRINCHELTSLQTCQVFLLPSHTATLTCTKDHSGFVENGFFARETPFLSVLYPVFSITRCFSRLWKLLQAAGQRPGLWTPSDEFGYSTSKTARQSHTESEWKQLLLPYSSKWLVNLYTRHSAVPHRWCLSCLSSDLVDVTAFQQSHILKRQAFWYAKLVLRSAIYV